MIGKTVLSMRAARGQLADAKQARRWAEIEKGLHRVEHHPPTARAQRLSLAAQLVWAVGTDGEIEADRKCLLLVAGQGLVHV